MSQFYIDNLHAERCRRSMREKSIITVTGSTATGEFREFTGTVVSIEEDKARPTRSRWLVTFQDAADPRSVGK